MKYSIIARNIYGVVIAVLIYTDQITIDVSMY